MIPCYRWSAKSYGKFDGLNLAEGISYFLGTIYPKSHVSKQYPMSTPLNYNPGRRFDSRSKWPGLIRPALDQGRCASSWAVSTAGMFALILLSDLIPFPYFSDYFATFSNSQSKTKNLDLEATFILGQRLLLGAKEYVHNQDYENIISI